MRYLNQKELDNLYKYKNKIITYSELKLFFHRERKLSQKVARIMRTGELIHICKGTYAFRQAKPELYQLGCLINKGSYITAETILQKNNIIPTSIKSQGNSDLTIYTHASINLTRVKQVKAYNTSYKFNRISPKLFFGFAKRYNYQNYFEYSEACIEKALLDYIYMRKPRIEDIKKFELEGKGINWNLYLRYMDRYPRWMDEYITSLPQHES